MQNVTYEETQDKYELLRMTVHKIAHENLPNVITNKMGLAILKSDISLKGLDFHSYQSLRVWNDSGQRVAPWDWDDVRKKYRSHPKRFELSIWHKQLFLCGASIGRPTVSGNKLRLDFIEANPTGSPLHGTITDIVILTGRLYAKAIGASQLRIMHPINKKVRDHYLSKGGFSFNEKGNFCFQDI